MLVSAAIVISIATFAAGVLWGRRGRPSVSIEPLSPATVPLVQVIAEFRDFAAQVEGGTISKEADEVVKLLEAHVAGKLLPPVKKEPDFAFASNGRPILVGEALKMFDIEFAACDDGGERMNIVRRWHNKGFVFSIALRERFVKNSANSHVRMELYNMFEEQDKPKS